MQIKSNAARFDHISLKMFKLVLPIIFPVLLHIYNYSISNNIFLDIWKMNLVRPVSKNHNPKHITDYRPISIAFALSKPLERIACKQLTSFLNTNNLLEPLQSGFRTKHSTYTASLKFTTDIKLAMDLKHITIDIFFAFSKALPSIDHNLSLNKLKTLKLSKSARSWFESYFTGRFQRVVDRNGESSHWDRVKGGVSQGASLSSLLLNFFLWLN